MKRDLSDYSMQELFALELEAQSAVLSQGLIDLEDSVYSEQKLEKLMRASHSIKGAARIIGWDELVSVAHKMEDCFVEAMKQQFLFPSSSIDVFLIAVDLMAAISNSKQGTIEENIKSTKLQFDELDEQLNQVQLAINQTENITQNKKKKTKLSRKKATKNTVKETKSKSQNSLDLYAPEPEPETEPESELRGSNHNNKTDPVVKDKSLRINVDRLSSLMGLSSELLIETQRIRPFSNSMIQLRKRYGEISSILDKLREGLQGEKVSERNMALLLEAQSKLFECRNTLGDRIADLDEFDRKSGNLSTKVYNELVLTRMRPFSDCTQGLDRTVRDVARSLGKKVKLEIQGLETPVDREILEKIKFPLVHMVRNAIDHGVETPTTRKKLGKPVEGKVLIKVGHAGAGLNLSVEDDGQGVDIELLKKNILEKGLSSPELLAEMSLSELFEFMYLPNFSTRSKVTEISGRGVGMDVVRTMIQDLQGNILTRNQPGKGMKINIQIPLTRSVISAAIVEIGGELYAFPLSRVNRLVTVQAKNLETHEHKQSISVDGKHLDVVPAGMVLGLDPKFYNREELYIVIIGDESKQYGVIVEKFMGQKELSVQNLDPRLGKIQDVASAALSEQGKPILIIDMDDFIRSTELTINGKYEAYFELEPRYRQVAKKILFIDDSLTVRELVKNLLALYGYSVELAVDGVDGWNTLRRSRFDLVITDIDMPRMDGIELVERIKSDNRLGAIPVMIISYKDRNEDRNRGLHAGADYYFAKGSFQDELLIDAVKDLIGNPMD